MANENETVEQVCEKLHKLGGEIRGMTKLSPYNIYTLSHIIDEAQDLILAANKRELAAKDEEIEGLKAKNTEAFKAVLKRDNEITRLKRENFDINGCLLAEQESVEKRDALIKELADKLACFLGCDGVDRDGADCYKKCPEESRQMCGRGKTCMLVAKAREMAK